MVLLWFYGHSEKAGNEHASTLARAGKYELRGSQMATIKINTEDCLEREQKKPVSTWPNPDKSKSKRQILKWDKKASKRFRTISAYKLKCCKC